MKRSLSIWVQLVVFALFLGGSTAAWYNQDYVTEVFAAFTEGEIQPQHKRSPGVPVVVAKAGERANDITIAAIATARAKRFVTLFPEVGGEIVQFHVQAGYRVISGEKIMTLDTRDAELAMQLAEVKVEEAELALARSRQLLERNVNSQAKVQDMRTLLDRARLELEQAKEALAKRTLRAPFPGVVGIPKVEVGDRVSATTEVITVDDRSSLLVEIEVPEQYLSAVERGQTVTARTPSFPDRAFEGTVDRIDSRVDPVSRTVMVRASLPNADDLLRPGMSFAVNLTIPGKAYPIVPELALQWGAGGKSYVWKVVNDKSERIEVRSVKRMNRVILVDGDIKPGELVVVEGVQRLRPGRKVSFALPDPAPGS